MSLHQEHAETSHPGFTDLFRFLRNTFQQEGLVSVPPEVLHRFKQCPLEGIHFTDLTSFADLFDGTRCSNAYRLEANSFVYTVQIIFHLKPTVVQEKILHLLMVSVRLLKDEDVASRRLSLLAGRQIDRYAVARKRATISNKLIPWLLKHFARNSTNPQLKIIAAQFLFHLLQGDKEAKNILNSAEKKERWSLGRALNSSAHLTVRIFAADILREMSLADIDWRIFLSPNSIQRDGAPLPSSFMADAEWLANVVQFLSGVDEYQAVSDDSRSNIYQLLSVRTVPIAFPEANSPIISIISDRISFILPADQRRPLQIMEIPLISDMQHSKIDNAHNHNNRLEETYELRMQLPNGGCYIWNGATSAVDQVNISFRTNSDCRSFGRAIDHSLGRFCRRWQAPVAEGEDVDEVGIVRGARKQSCSMMIDLSQDVEASDDTVLSLLQNERPNNASTSGRNEISMSEKPSAPLQSPIQDSTGHNKIHLQTRKPFEQHFSKKPSRRRHGLDGRERSRADKSSSLEHGGDRSEALLPAWRKSKHRHPTESSVAPTTLQGKTWSHEAPAYGAQKRLPLLLRSQQARARHSAQVSSNLQHLAPEALHQSKDHSTNMAVTRNRRALPSQGNRISSADVRQRRLYQRPPSLTSISSNSAKYASPEQKPVSLKLPLTRNRLQDRDNKMLRKVPRLPLQSNSVKSGKAKVDWDEDLREDEDRGEKKGPELSNTSPDGKKNVRAKTSAAGRKSKKPSVSKKPTTRAKLGKPQLESISYLPTSRHHEFTGGFLQKKEPESVVLGHASRHAANNHHRSGLQPIESTTQSPGMLTDHANDEGVNVEAEKIPTMVRETPHAGSRVTSADSVAFAEMHNGARVVPASSDTKQRPMEILLPDKSMLSDQKSDKIRDCAEAAGGRAEAEVEVIHDSHPMDKPRSENAITAARRTFGSALVDVMSANGMQVVENSPSDERGKKPLMDEVRAGFQTAQECGNDCLDSSIDDHSSQSSTRMRQSDAALQQRKRVDPLLSARTVEQSPAEPNVSHCQSLEEFEEVLPVTAKVAYSPARSGHLYHTDRLTSCPHYCQSTDNQFRSPKGGDDSTDKKSKTRVEDTGTLHDNHKESVFKNTTLVAASPRDNTLASTQAGERKRASMKLTEESHRLKRSCSSNSDPSLPVAVLLEDRVINFRETKEFIGPSSTDGKTASEKPARVLDVATKIEKPVAAYLTQRGEIHSSKCELPESRIFTPIETDHVGRDTHKTCGEIPAASGTGDNRLRRNGLNEVISVDSDGLSQAARGFAQGTSVPTEIDKHLAFKRVQSRKPFPRSKKRIPHAARLFRENTRRRVQFTFSDPESSEARSRLSEKSSDANTAAVNQRANGKRGLTSSKVDENGSPRLHLPSIPRISPAELTWLAGEGSVSSGGNNDASSTSEKSDPEWVPGNQSTSLKLENTVLQYKSATARDRSRVSIGVEKLLNRTFPLASQKIETKPFKFGDVGGIVKPSNKFQESKSPRRHSPRKSHPQNEQEKIACTAPGKNTGHVRMETTFPFDIGQLHVSAADESSSPRDMGIRRVRSSSVALPPINDAGSNVSPASFKTRLSKMAMTFRPMKNLDGDIERSATKGDTRRGQDTSATIDAEAGTTLVSGETYEDDSIRPPPQNQPRVLFSSSTPSGSLPSATGSSVKLRRYQRSGTDRKFWNQKIAETQQDVTEILEHVSHVSSLLASPHTILILKKKLLSRFLHAEEDIGHQLNYYRFGGRKILNNLVEQFDQRVTQEKRIPSLRTVQYRREVADAINLLQEEKKSTRLGPSLDDLRKSHNRRCGYIMANLETFASAQS